jgi:hypothetical protein
MDVNDMSPTGAFLYDRSGRNNHGTVTGTTTSTGRIGKARAFNGTSDYITYSGNMGISNSITVNAWVRPDFFDGAYHMILSSDTDNSNYFTIDPNNEFRAIWRLGAVNCGTWTTGVLSKIGAGKWIMLTATYSPSSNVVALYVDGVWRANSAACGDITLASWDDPQVIGAYHDYSWKFSGSIDDVRIYNRALSEQEVAVLYKSAKVGYETAPTRGFAGKQLVARYTLDASDISSMGALAKAYDKSGFNGHAISRLTPRLVAGKIGQGFVFDGSTEIVTSTLASPITGDTTITGWLKYTTASGQLRAIDLAQDATVGMQICVNAGNILIDNSGGPTGAIADTVKTNDDKWHFVAFVRSGTNYYLYVDDRYIGTAGGTVVTYTKVMIGGVGTPPQGAPHFPGSIDDVRVYNYAMSAQEISALYKSAKSSYESAPTRTGLVGYWTMDSSDATSTPWIFYDRSGFGNNATSTGSPTIAAGKINQSASLNGSTQYLDAVTNSRYNLAGGGTVSAWVKINSATVQHGIVQNGNNQVSQGGGWVLAIRTDSGITFVQSCTAGSEGYESTYTPGYFVPANQWTHIAVTYNSSDPNTSAVIYVDGVLKTTNVAANCSSGVAILSTGNLGIGKAVAGLTGHMNGFIDDVRIYNRTLSAQEIVNLYKGSKKVYMK